MTVVWNIGSIPASFSWRQSAKPWKSYYYKVKAIHANTAANSAFSTAKYRTVDLAQPKVQQELIKAGKPQITWKTVTGR